MIENQQKENDVTETKESSQFKSKADTFWGARIRQFASNTNDIEGLEKFQNARLNDAAAWSIFGALMMTVALGGCFIFIETSKESSFSDSMGYLYVISVVISAQASTVTVVSGTYTYLLFNSIPLKKIDDALESTRYLVNIGPGSVYVSVIFINIACIAAIYRLWGSSYAVAALTFGLTGFGVIVYVSVATGRIMNKLIKVDALFA